MRQHPGIDAGIEDVPTGLLRAALDQRAPVARQQVDVHARRFELVRRDLGERIDERNLLRGQHRDLLALVARLRQQLPRLRDIGLLVRLAPRLRRIGRAASEEGIAGLPPLLVGGERGGEVVLLVHQHRHRLARARVVEGRLGFVHPHERHVAVLRELAHLDALLPAELRDSVMRQLVEQIDLALLQRIDARLQIGDDVPLHAIHQHALAAGIAVRRRIDRLVVRVLLEDELRARVVLGGDEAERAFAVGRAHRPVAGGLQVRGAHDDAARLGERELDIGEGLRKGDAEALLAGGLERALALEHELDQRHLLARTLDGRDHVRARHLLAAVEHEPVAQREIVGEPVVRHALAAHHLLLRLEIGVERKERVVHHQAEDGRHGRGGDVRVEDADIGLRHDMEDALRLRGRRGKRADDADRGQEFRNAHSEDPLKPARSWCGIRSRLRPAARADARCGIRRAARARTGPGSAGCRARRNCRCSAPPGSGRARRNRRRCGIRRRSSR